jgi:6-pyruvoyltetrahydropterin/6-carboxytetrahydropterin synthase
MKGKTMWEITKTFRFEAAHFLPKVEDGHQCGRMHGHSYVVEVSASAPALTAQNWVVDFSEVSAAAKPLVQSLDHQVLNEFDGLEDPTSEKLAEWFWDQLSDRIDCLSAVTVHETESSRCQYRRPAPIQELS